MKNEKDKSQDKDRLTNQQDTRVEDAQSRKQGKGLSREEQEEEFEGGDFEANSDLREEGDNTKQDRKDNTKSEKSPHLRDEYQGGSGKGIDVD